jgi:hypothetical protein
LIAVENQHSRFVVQLAQLTGQSFCRSSTTPAPRQPLCVFGKLRHVFAATRQAIEQLLMKGAGRWRKAVVVPKPVLPRLNQPRPPQIRQVPRSGRLRHVEDADDIAYAQLAREEQIQYPQPRPIGERAENAVDIGGRGRFHIFA